MYVYVCMCVCIRVYMCVYCVFYMKLDINRRHFYELRDSFHDYLVFLKYPVMAQHLLVRLFCSQIYVIIICRYKIKLEK